MEAQGVVGAAGGASETKPPSPHSARHPPPNGELKRKRSSITGGGASGNALESSPGSIGDDDHMLPNDSERKRLPGVKRACNECRQQKLRCDVIQDPFNSCSRCNRLKLECKIESNFKRVGKRSKHAEMEKEIEGLRRLMDRARQQGFAFEEDDGMHSQLQSPVANSVYTHTRNTSHMGSDEVVSSLIHLKQGGGNFNLLRIHELGNVRLTDDMVSQLFHEFFTFYHPFLPFLNPAQTPDQYKMQHELLFWSIISIAARRYSADPGLLEAISGPLADLLWKTIGEVPSNYYIIKALCLLCTWPLPTYTTTSDPTHIMCGVMMKSATGIGLHRPSHIQDFSRVSVELNKEQLHDRVETWAVCNIVAQSIGTGYGQPASTLYDWTLAPRPGDEGPFTLSAELEARLQIETFCDKVSKEMYSNAMDPRGVAGDEHRAMLMRVYRRDFGELQAAIMSQTALSPILRLHLKAAHLHLRLAGFFDSSTTPGYMDDLMGLWRATTGFLDTFTDLDPSTGNNISPILPYCTNYIQQMLVAAGFALLKLMNSFFAKSIDGNRGRQLFHLTVAAIRTTSVVPKDLQSKLAELMAQMWSGYRLDSNVKSEPGEYDQPVPMNDSLQLKVRCRHSMSLVFDSIWCWRENFAGKGRGSLDGLSRSHHNNQDGTHLEHSASSSAQLDGSLMASVPGMQPSLLGAANGPMTSGAAGVSGVSSAMIGGASLSAQYVEQAPQPQQYDLWDSNHWILDNLLDFNYNNYAQPLEGT